eukprot:CAMPEP_0114650892 /NCGR_PEP_ID=MMETSP0191-20121206/7964_1 /TAXON_ID=126664 /ORGANISM="Sorites sp." /LENGTH=112 /DNA_ID=CAMNT_0001864893 /DNA_START=681 /DNA_END=1019 /DNA_ORIENTATION=-
MKTFSRKLPLSGFVSITTGVISTGVLVGNPVGEYVGFIVGAFDGPLVGVFDGALLGMSVGLVVGVTWNGIAIDCSIGGEKLENKGILVGYPLGLSIAIWNPSQDEISLLHSI